MRRSITLGLAAATTVAALALPALSTAASASPTPTPAPTSNLKAPHDWGYDGWWGTYWSSNHLAKARGWIDVDYNGFKSNKVHITGKLYDNDHRTLKQGGKCAYVKFRFQYWDDGKYHWASGNKTYKYCGAGGYKKIDFWRHDVAQVQAKVCQVGLYSKYPVKCGYWHDLYSAYKGKYGYDA